MPRMTHPVENNTAPGNGCHLETATDDVWAGLCRCWSKRVAETEGMRGASQSIGAAQEWAGRPVSWGAGVTPW